MCDMGSNMSAKPFQAKRKFGEAIESFLNSIHSFISLSLWSLSYTGQYTKSTTFSTLFHGRNYYQQGTRSHDSAFEEIRKET